jgi:hypothetical protein
MSKTLQVKPLKVHEQDISRGVSQSQEQDNSGKARKSYK